MSLEGGRKEPVRLNLMKGSELHRADVYGRAGLMTAGYMLVSWSTAPGLMHVGLQCSPFLLGLCVLKPAPVACVVSPL